MHVGQPLVADGESPILGKPRQRPFHDPPMPTELLARLDAAAGDARCDAPPAAGVPTTVVVIPLVAVELVGALAGAAPESLDRPDRIEQRLQQARVVPVGRADEDRKRDASAVHEHMMLGARPAPVGRIRAGLFAPLFAGILAESSAARDQSMRPRLPRRSSSRRWRRSHTPARCHSRSRRQQVLPLPQPNSFGRACQGQPVLSTNRMPVSAARSETRGRPPFGLGGSAGSSGAMRVQRPSGRSGALILSVEQVRF